VNEKFRGSVLTASRQLPRQCNFKLCRVRKSVL